MLLAVATIAGFSSRPVVLPDAIVNHPVFQRLAGFVPESLISNRAAISLRCPQAGVVVTASSDEIIYPAIPLSFRSGPVNCRASAISIGTTTDCLSLEMLIAAGSWCQNTADDVAKRQKNGGVFSVGYK